MNAYCNGCEVHKCTSQGLVVHINTRVVNTLTYTQNVSSPWQPNVCYFLSVAPSNYHYSDHDHRHLEFSLFHTLSMEAHSINSFEYGWMLYLNIVGIPSCCCVNQHLLFGMPSNYITLGHSTISVFLLHFIHCIVSLNDCSGSNCCK